MGVWMCVCEPYLCVWRAGGDVVEVGDRMREWHDGSKAWVMHENTDNRAASVALSWMLSNSEQTHI